MELGKLSLSGTTSDGFPLLFMFCWSSSVSLTHFFHTMLYNWGDMSLYQSRQLCCYVCNCPKFILILKSINCTARVALLPISTLTPKCLPFLPTAPLNAVCLAATLSLSWPQQCVARRLIDLRVEKWVESLMTSYIRQKSIALGPCLLCFTTVSPVPCT